MKSIKAWHFLEATGKGYHSKYAPPESRRWEPKIDEIMMCQSGYHASRNPLDGLNYGGDVAIVRRVELAGEMIIGDDKIVAQRRRELWRADCTRTLHEFAVWCARRALARIDKPDPRSEHALRAKIAWLNGDATDAELAAAGAAAWAAAAEAAAWAAWAAAAEAAARAAAWAARAAAGAAEAWAARAAAGDAERKTQARKLSAMLRKLKP